MSKKWKKMEFVENLRVLIFFFSFLFFIYLFCNSAVYVCIFVLRKDEEGGFFFFYWPDSAGNALEII